MVGGGGSAEGQSTRFLEGSVSMAVPDKHVGQVIYLVIANLRLPIEVVFISGTFP